MKLDSRIIAGLLVLILTVSPAFCEVKLSLVRKFGTEIGGEIRGTFTVKAKAPDASSVSFYLDDQLVSTDSIEPFKWTFNTHNYPGGAHVIKAVASFPDGRIDEGTIRVQFVSKFGSKMLIFVAIVVLSVAGSILLGLVLAQREKQRYQGRTRCPVCGTVFDRQWSYFHMGKAYRNTCPTCGHKFWAEAISDEESP